MPMTVTRSFIRETARTLADAPASGHSSDTQLNVMINQSAKWLWTDMVLGDPDRHAVTVSVATTTGTTSYALPAAFYEVRGVDLVQGTQRYRVERFEWGERNQNQGWPFAPVGAGVRYRVTGGGQDGTLTRLTFDGDPGTNTYEVRYITTPPSLAADGDVIDGVAGWEDIVIYDVAAKIATRAEELELAATLRAERDRMKAAMNLLATTRDVGSAPRIADTRYRNDARMR